MCKWLAYVNSFVNKLLFWHLKNGNNSNNTFPFRCTFGSLNQWCCIVQMAAVIYEDFLFLFICPSASFSFSSSLICNLSQPILTVGKVHRSFWILRGWLNAGLLFKDLLILKELERTSKASAFDAEWTQLCPDDWMPF